jgi:hypothetical protein
MSTATETNPNPAPTEGREACGRFAKGNPGGPGNPYPRRLAALRQALLKCVTEEDIVAITKAVIEEAKAGNMAAAKLLFQYVFGKPGSAPELDLYAGSAPSPSADADGDNAPSAPIPNGSNGPSLPSGSAAPKTEFSRESQLWLDRQVHRAMEALGKEPLIKGI